MLLHLVVCGGQSRWSSTSFSTNRELQAKVCVIFQDLEKQSLQPSEAFRELNKLKLNELSGRERLGLYALAASQGSTSSKAIADNFERLNLEGVDRDLRLRFCSDLSEGRPFSSAVFCKLGFLEEVQSASPDQKDLVFHSFDFISAPWLADGLADHFDRLGIIEEVAKEATLQGRLDRWKELARCSYWIGAGMARFYERLGLEGLSDNDRFAFCSFLLEQRECPVKNVIAYLPKFNLVWSSSAERLEFYRKVIEKGDDAARGVIDNIPQLGLDTFSDDELFAFCKSLGRFNLTPHFIALGFPERFAKRDGIDAKIAFWRKVGTLGEWTSKALRTNDGLLGFQQELRKCASFEARVQASGKLKGTLDETVFDLKEYFVELGFIDDIKSAPTLDMKLETCDRLYAEGHWATYNLYAEFDRLGIMEELMAITDRDARFVLCQKVASHPFAAMALGKRYKKLGFDNVDFVPIASDRGVLQYQMAMTEGMQKISI